MSSDGDTEFLYYAQTDLVVDGKAICTTVLRIAYLRNQRAARQQLSVGCIVIVPLPFVLYSVLCSPPVWHYLETLEGGYVHGELFVDGVHGEELGTLAAPLGRRGMARGSRRVIQ